MKNFVLGLMLGGLVVFITYWSLETPPPPPVIAEIEKPEPTVVETNQSSEAVNAIEKTRKTIKKPKRPFSQSTCPEPTRDAVEKLCRKTFANMTKKQKIMWIKGIDPNNPHPGHIKMNEPGTVLDDGSIAGEAEASLYIEFFEKDLYEKLQAMDPDELREKYANELHWFQRVGNFKKAQKCQALQKMQKDFGLERTFELISTVKGFTFY